MARLSQEEFIGRMKKLFGEKYDFSEARYTRNSARVTVRCPQHGVFTPTALSLMTGRGCRACGRDSASKKQRLSRDQIIQNFQNVHGTLYDYSKMNSPKNNREKVEIVCSEHGSFWQRVTRHQEGDGCPTCWEKQNYGTTQTFLDKARNVHGDKFVYTKTDFTNAKTPLTITCREHGDFTVMPNNHLRGKGGCKTCLPEFISTAQSLGIDEIRQRIDIVYPYKIDWENSSVSKSAQDLSTFVCPDHGPFQTVTSNILHQAGGCRQCIGPSNAEKEIWNFLSKYEINIVSNSRRIIAPFELDLFFPDHQFAIEYGGLYWHSEHVIPDRHYHRKKYLLCKEKGIRLVTFFSDEWLNKRSIIESMLGSRLGRTPTKINGRDTDIVILSPQERREFFDLNHLQGDVGATVAYGLRHQDRLVAAMSFGRGRFHKDQWEMYRFAISLNTTVRGGLGKLLNTFINRHDPGQIRTYADLRFGEGTGYAKVGFTRLPDTVIGFTYLTPDRSERHSRFRYQKQKLVDAGFDALQSEQQIMKDRGFSRIWDCGNAVYEWIRTPRKSD